LPLRVAPKLLLLGGSAESFVSEAPQLPVCLQEKNYGVLALLKLATLATLFTLQENNPSYTGAHPKNP
jgi:hypothetical protein